MSSRIYSTENLTFTKSAEGGQRFRNLHSYGGNKALVFVSHRQADTQAAWAIARALIEIADVDVFLDAFNPALSTSGNPEKVTGVIDFGLSACTHLLAVVSDNTRGSWWVPYEFGVARNRPVPCGLTLLQNVKDLPEYLQTAHTVQDVYGLVNWAKTTLPQVRVHKSVNPSDITVPGLPQFRREGVVFRG